MLFTKRLFLIILSIISLSLICCYGKSLRKKTRLSYSISYIVLSCLISIYLFASIICVKNVDIVLFLYGLYFAMFDVTLFLLLKLMLVLEGKEENSLVEKLHIYIIGGLTVIDIICILSSAAFRLRIEPLYIRGSFYCWHIIFSNVFIIHYSICFVISVLLIVKLIKDCFEAVSFYKKKFWLMLILFIIYITCNSLYVIKSNEWKIDYSLIVSGLICISAFSFSMYGIPKSVQAKMLSIANDSISDAVICFDDKNECIYTNKTARQIYAPGKDLWIKKYLNVNEDYISATEFFTIKDENHIFHLEYRKIRDKKNRLAGSYFKLNDRTVEVKNIELEEYRATHDELTGLFNRNHFFTEMERMLKMTPEVPRYLVCTNIKKFRLINDLFGPKFGDSLLQKQAEMLLCAKSDGVIIGRISGDKFAMLIPKDKFNPELAIKNTIRVREAAEDLNFPLKIRLGVYEIANANENVHSMFDKANLAIKNMNDSTNQVMAVYDTSLMQQLLHEKTIISEFKYALQSGQFLMFLQAQVNSKDERCIGAEALVRWYDIEKGYRQPNEFISILEKSGLIYKLDFYVWEKAVQTLSKWQTAGISNCYISVNISARDFYFADLYEVFTHLVEKYDVPPSQLNLEITESVLMDNQKLHKTVLSRLQEYGFRIEMDDFGSGYSSLNVLKDISMDVLKIDMGFLRHSQNEERGKLIINSIVKMAQALGMEVICEGVETDEQRKYLKEVGVDIFQGYYFSKPIPLEDFEHKYLEAIK